MDLPNLLTKFKNTPQEINQFLAIEIGLDAVKSAVWQVVKDQPQIVTIGSLESYTPKDEESLLLAIDKSLSTALSEIEKEPNAVIFGLPINWTNKDGIADAHKALLKVICQKLSLKAIGFVVTIEAVVHYLKDTEGGPPSAVVINLADHEIAVSVVKLGELTGTQVVGRSDALSSDVEEGLARFPRSGENLPSRMILYDGHHDLEAAKQELLTHDWQRKLAFLHFPKVENLDSDTTIKAIALGGGPEAARSQGLLEEEGQETTPVVATKSRLEKTAASKEAAEEIVENTAQLGFTEANDNTPLVSEELVEVPSEEEPQFTIHGGNTTENPAPPPKNILKNLLSGFSNLKLPKFKPSFNPHSLTQKSFNPLIAVAIIAPIIILLGIAGVITLINYPRLDLTVYLQTQPLEKEITFTLDPNAQAVDDNQYLIPTQKQIVEVTDTAKIQTTGNLTVGEKAKGSATLYNRTTATKTFAAGTTLTVDSLKFILDENVTVASASTKENADLSVTTEPSKVAINLTAGAIGAEYNLTGGTQLKVANFGADSFLAKIDTGLTGGSSRQVQAVSQKDQQTLKATLLQNLKSKAAQELSQKTANQQNVINTDEQELISEEYTADIGDEANSLDLTMSVRQTAYLYNPSDLTLLAQKSLLNDIPMGYSLYGNQIAVTPTQNVPNQNGSVTVTAKVTLKLMPKLTDKDIINSIKGKTPTVATNYLRNLPGFDHAETKFNTNLPLLNYIFPTRADHISLTVKPAN